MNLLFQLLDLLLTNLHQEVKYYSDFKWNHPYFQSIVNLGKLHPQQVIPWLLERCSNDWYCCGALNEIVPIEKRPAIPKKIAGYLDEISATWLTWGQINGYVIVESK